MEFIHEDKVTQRAVEALNRNETQGRPLYEAAASIVREEEVARKAALWLRAEGCHGPLDPRLFPPDVFDSEGNRLTYSNGRPRLTGTEERSAFELEDSRASFS